MIQQSDAEQGPTGSPATWCATHSDLGLAFTLNENGSAALMFHNSEDKQNPWK
jgi:hypothetical protein